MAYNVTMPSPEVNCLLRIQKVQLQMMLIAFFLLKYATSVFHDELHYRCDMLL